MNVTQNVVDAPVEDVARQPDAALAQARGTGPAWVRFGQRAAVVVGVLAFVTAAALVSLEREHRADVQLEAVDAATEVATSLVAAGYAADAEGGLATGEGLAAALLASDATGGVLWHTSRGQIVSAGELADEPTSSGLVAEVLGSGRPRADDATINGVSAVRVLAPVARTETGGIVLESVTSLGDVDDVIARERRAGAAGMLAASLLAVAGLAAIDRRRDLRAAEQAAALRAMVARDARTMMDSSDVERIKGDFLTTVSHEVRTPLQVVRGTAQLLSTRADAMTPQQIADLAGRLGANAKRLDSLLSDMLDLDRLGQGLVESRREPVVVADALDTALRTVELDGATVTRDVGDLAVQATPAHVERILEHLLRNAVKYGTDGEHPATIAILAHREGDATTVIVSDDGPGIPPAERIRVFDPLYRIHDDRADPGTGVGLALVRRLTRLYGGRVWVEEARGGGAALHVHIPDVGEPLTIDTWNLSSTVDARRG